MDHDEQVRTAGGTAPDVSVGDRATGAVEAISSRLALLEREYEARLHDSAVGQIAFRSSWEVAGEGIVGFMAAVADLSVQLETGRPDIDVLDTDGSAVASHRDATGCAVDELLTWGAGWATIMIDDLIVVTELLLSGLHPAPPGDGGERPRRHGRADLSIVWPAAAQGGSRS
jgi:hypothetical protein